MTERLSLLEAPPMSDADFGRLGGLAHDLAGIKLSPAKRDLLQARLARRLRTLGLRSWHEYYKLVTQPSSDAERIEFVNAITTNKTDFFREPHHFAFLRDRAFPELRARVRTGGRRRLRIWSAGCSTGEEPYSIAMTVRDHLDAPGVQVEIVATDIDTQVLAHARAGVYDAARMAGVPADVRARHFVQKDGARGKVFQLRTEARDLVRFERFNLTGDRWAIGEPFDLVFCRNVIIYFDRATQVGLFERFARVVAPHGYLVLGHSESLHGVSDRFRSIGVTVYAPATAAVAGRRSRASRAVRPAAAGRVSRASRAVRPAAERRRTGHPAVATGLPQHRITVGEVKSSGAPALISTVLGSCVSACLFDPEARVGGMNHFCLPRGGDDDPTRPERYGVHAMELLVNELLGLGAQRSRLVAKIFGGAKVTVGLSDVGAGNVRFVREFLSAEKIAVAAEHVGGTRPLEIHLVSSTGKVYVREVPATRAVIASEARALRTVETRPVVSEVTLFGS